MDGINKFDVGATVRIANLENSSAWSWLIQDHRLVANRQASGSGKVVGFYRLSKNTIVCVAHDGGASAVYDENELE